MAHDELDELPAMLDRERALIDRYELEARGGGNADDVAEDYRDRPTTLGRAELVRPYRRSAHAGRFLPFIPRWMTSVSPRLRRLRSLRS